MNVFQHKNESLWLALFASCDVGMLAATIEELARRDADEVDRVADGRINIFVKNLTTHDAPRVREAALELIAKHRRYVIVDAAYDALLRQESLPIWSTAAYAITQCPDDLDRIDANVLLRHQDIVQFRLRHVGYEHAYRRLPEVSTVIDRLLEARDMLLCAGTGAKPDP